VQHAQRACYRP